jgi:hypothetical protein
MVVGLIAEVGGIEYDVLGLGSECCGLELGCPALT